MNIGRTNYPRCTFFSWPKYPKLVIHTHMNDSPCQYPPLLKSGGTQILATLSISLTEGTRK